MKKVLLLTLGLGLGWPVVARAQDSSADDGLMLENIQLRLGLHGAYQLGDGQRRPVQLTTHLIVPNAASWSSPWLYGGVRFTLTERWSQDSEPALLQRWSMEVLGGVGTEPDSNTPAVSVRVQGSSSRFYLWGDLEYWPLLDNTVYGFLVAQAKVGSVQLGVESENRMPLSALEDRYVSVGPSVWVPVGDHVLLATTTYFTWEGGVFQRFYFHLMF